MNDNYGDVGSKTLKNAADSKENVYGSIRIRLSFAVPEEVYASDESFSDEDMEADDDLASPGLHRRKAGIAGGIVVVKEEVNSSDEAEERASSEEEMVDHR